MEHILRILFTRSGPSYEAHVTRSATGVTPSVSFAPPGGLAFHHVRSAVRHWRGNEPAAVAETPASLETIGSRLYHALFTLGLHNAFIASRQTARAAGSVLQLQLQFSSTPELATLPWELLYDDAERGFLTMSGDVSISRYLAAAAPRKPLSLLPPLRVLVMSALPEDTHPLDNAKDEVRRLKQRLLSFAKAGILQVDEAEAGTLRALQARLAGGTYHAFHFIGHGGVDNGEGILVFENDGGRSDFVPASVLAAHLASHQSLRLVVLNSCEGSKPSETDAFSGTAQLLVQRGLPAVVGMHYEISDIAAGHFADAFYHAIAAHKPVDDAVAEGRRAIREQAEFSTPTLYLESRTPFVPPPPPLTRALMHTPFGESVVGWLRWAAPGDPAPTRFWGAAASGAAFGAVVLVGAAVYRQWFNIAVLPGLNRALEPNELVMASIVLALSGVGLFVAWQRQPWIAALGLTRHGYPATGRLALYLAVVMLALLWFERIPPTITIDTCAGAVPFVPLDGWQPLIRSSNARKSEEFHQQVRWYIGGGNSPRPIYLRVSIEPKETTDFARVHLDPARARAVDHACSDATEACVVNDVVPTRDLNAGLIYGVASDVVDADRKAYLNDVITTAQLLDADGRRLGQAELRREAYFDRAPGVAVPDCLAHH
jgi:hypothetical protein